MTRKQSHDEQNANQGPARALIYLRASTKEQAAQSGDAEGFRSRPNAMSSHQYLPLTPTEVAA